MAKATSKLTRTTSSKPQASDKGSKGPAIPKPTQGSAAKVSMQPGTGRRTGAQKAPPKQTMPQGKVGQMPGQLVNGLPTPLAQGRIRAPLVGGPVPKGSPR